MRILRKVLAGLARHRILVAADQIDPVVAGQIGVERVALAVLEGIEDVLEMMMLEAEHDIGIHGDEAAIAVIGEAAIARHFGERFHRLVVEAEIEHGIHHARHRGAAARAHRDQQRIFGIAERLAGDLADMLQRLLDLALQRRRIGFVMRVEIGADRGRNGEAGRHRQAEIGHLGEIGALAAQQIAQARLAFGLAVAEGEHPFAGSIAAVALAAGFAAAFAQSWRQISALGLAEPSSAPCGPQPAEPPWRGPLSIPLISLQFSSSSSLRLWP